MTELLFRREVFAVVGAAIEVHRELGPRFLEAVYQEAFEIELAHQKLPFEAQKQIDIRYKGTKITKEYIADIVCYDQST